MSEISRFEYRAIIKFVTLEKQPSNNIYERLVNVYGDSAPFYSTVTRWGCWILTWPNITWRWHPSWTASRSDYWWLLPCCRKAGDGRSKTESPGDSHRSGHFKCHHLEYFIEHLRLSKVRARWAPCFDTRSEVISGGNMFGAVGYLHCNPDSVLSRLITGDETWIHHWD